MYYNLNWFFVGNENLSIILVQNLTECNLKKQLSYILLFTKLQVALKISPHQIFYAINIYKILPGELGMFVFCFAIVDVDLPPKKY